MSVLLVVAAGALIGLAAGIVAGRWGWLALVAFALVIYISIGTGNDVPPDWMATAVPGVPFAFLGVGIGIGVRRALYDGRRGEREGFSLLPRSASGADEIQGESDLVEALGVVSLMLATDFDGSAAYRRQFDVATLTRHGTGYSIAVDRSRAAPAELDPARLNARLPVEATGPGDIRIWLHATEGYLDELELLNASRFPDAATLRIRLT